MKILYHHRTQAEDAQGIHIVEMIKAFKGIGHQVESAAIVQTDQQKKITKNSSGWRTYVKKMPRWLYEIIGLAYNIVGYRILSKRINEFRPDFIYERYSLNTFCGILASKKYKIPLILEVNSPLHREQSDLNELNFKSSSRLLEKWICSNSFYTITVTQVLKNILVDEGVPKKKIIVIPNAIDPYKFNMSIKGTGIRNKYELEEKTVIGFVGWFRLWHGLDMLVKTAIKNNFLGKGCKLLLVGDGPAFNDLYRIAAGNKLLNDIIFTGPVPHEQIPEYIAAMDIVIQPNATEYACPMKIIEYMGMGKAILSIDQDNTRELISDGVTGMLFSDETEMVEKLSQLIEDSKMRRNMGDRAYKYIYNNNYLWTDNAKRVINLITP